MQRRIHVQIGDTVLVRALIENDAATNVTNSRLLVAHQTRFSLRVPPYNTSEVPLIGVISAANTTPRRIDDSVYLWSNKRFAVEYDWGSARLANRTHKEFLLSDDILGEGILVGSGEPDGDFPPGLSNAAAVLFLVHIVAPSANYEETT
jgi:hypothetical protein